MFVVTEIDHKRLLRRERYVDMLAERDPAGGLAEPAVRSERRDRVEQSGAAKKMASLVDI